MTVIADRQGQSPDPVRDPGTSRVRRVDVALFYGGLVAITALLVFGTLSVLAVLPMIVPGYTSASISSGSMMPTLRIGDVVIAVDHGGAVIEPETIVVYEDPRKHDLVTHRVVSVNPDGSYITKGDVNGGNDAIRFLRQTSGERPGGSFPTSGSPVSGSPRVGGCSSL